MSLGQALAQYVAGIKLASVPQRDIDVAKLAILDQIGVALAGFLQLGADALLLDLPGQQLIDDIGPGDLQAEHGHRRRRSAPRR